MAVATRGGKWYVRILPYGKLVTVATPARSEQEAKDIERAILRACQTNSFAHLDPVERSVCVRLFKNRKWGIPEDLYVEPQEQKRWDMSLKDAVALFGCYPGIRESKGKWRYAYAFPHLLMYFKPDRSVKTIWIPELRAYQVHRQAQGAAPATINRELTTLSKLFGMLVEMRVVDVNPCRQLKRLSEASSRRSAYLSYEDTERIANHCPDWFQPMVWTAYYTGMRRGEVFGLTRQGVNLQKRIISLQGNETKEGYPKRVPIHQDLVPILEDATRVPVLGTDRVFLLCDHKGFRPPTLEAMKNPWARALEAINVALTKLKQPAWSKPWPRFHDLRHTWRANARRSGMSDSIAEAILGHADRTVPVSQRYGWISDEELVVAVDAMTFDHGETKVRVAR